MTNEMQKKQEIDKSQDEKTYHKADETKMNFLLYE